MTTNTTQDPRWAQAEAILKGRQEPGALPGGGMRHYRGYLVLAAVILAVFVIGVVILVVALAHGGHHGPSHRVHSTPTPRWREVLAGVVIAVGLALDVLGLVLVSRTGLFGRRWRSAVAVLNQGQKNELKREVTGRAPLDPAHLPLARDFALRMTHLKASPLVLLGVGVMQIGSTITSPTSERFAVVAFVVVLIGVTTMTTYRNARLAQRFLDQHPSDRAAPDQNA